MIPITESGLSIWPYNNEVDLSSSFGDTPFPLVDCDARFICDLSGKCIMLRIYFTAASLWGDRYHSFLHNPNRPFTVDEVRLE